MPRERDPTARVQSIQDTTPGPVQLVVRLLLAPALHKGRRANPVDVRQLGWPFTEGEPLVAPQPWKSVSFFAFRFLFQLFRFLIF